MKLSKELKTGILLIVSILFFIYGLNYLKGYDLFSTSDEYYVVYDDASGLLESNPILINGMRVGKIQKIYFHPDNSGKVIVKFLLMNNDFKIPKDSKAIIAALDLLGAKGIKIIPGKATTYVEDGDTLFGGIEDGMVDKVTKELLPTKQKAENLITSIDSTLQQINSVLTNGGKNSIKGILDNLNSTTAHVDELVVEQQARLSKIMANAESISTNLKNNEDKLNAILKNFALISDSIAKSNLKTTINNADKALAELAAVMEKINKGKGSVGMLVNNDSLYRHLDASSKDLDLLFIDLKEHPSRYVHFSMFGKKEKRSKK